MSRPNTRRRNRTTPQQGGPLAPWPHQTPQQAVGAEPALDLEVALDIKVVASGISIGDHGKRKLRAALVISPSAKSGAEGEVKVKLSEWPSRIEELLSADLPVSVACLPAGHDAELDHRFRPTDAHRNTQLLFRRRVKRSDNIDRITSCWQQVMGATSDGNLRPWAGLAGVFQKPAGETPGLQARQVGNDKKTNIVAVPRGDMALFLQAWRARVVLASLGHNNRPLIEPGCDPIADLQRWILEDKDLEMLAGRAASSVAGVDQKLVTDVLQQLGKHLKKREDYLGASTALAALKQLDSFRCAVSQCDTPLKVIEPIATENESAIHEMFRVHRALHDAQLAIEENLRKQIEGKPPASGQGEYTDRQPARAIEWAKPKPEQSSDRSRHIAQSRLYSLQAIPALARIFRFSVDVEAELGDMSLVPQDGQPDRQLPTAETASADMAAVFSWVSAAHILEFDTVDADVSKSERVAPTTSTMPTTHYLFLSAAVGGKKYPWTTAKLRYPTGDRWSDPVDPASKAIVTGHFLPCTMEEIDTAAVLIKRPGQVCELGQEAQCVRKVDGNNRYIMPGIRDGRIVQFDGVLDLGAGRRATDPAQRRPRYDMVSLDVISAMESQINLARAEYDRRRAGSESTVDERPTYRTSGLMLVDRWSAAAAVESVGDRERRKADGASGAIFDATALTVGYRIDVGVRVKASADPHHFRALGNRLVSYSFPPDRALIESELQHLGYGKDELTLESRIRLDSTPVVPCTRVTGSTPANERRYPEEILANWEGDPLGLQCVRTWDGQDVEVDVDPGDDLAISRRYEIPDDEGIDYRIPRLLFGRRYRYGMRAEFLGGVVTPLKRARAIYEEAAGGMLALPEAPASETSGTNDNLTIKGRRHLRHERIAAPHVTVPEAEVVAARKRGKGRLRDQSSREAIVRTATPKAGGNAGRDTDKMSRIFFAPGVPQDFAEMHGALLNARPLSGPAIGRNPLNPKERRTVVVDRPFDGLKNVSYSFSNGGFPVRSSDNLVATEAPSDPTTFKSDEKSAPQLRDPVFVVEPADDRNRAARHLARLEPYYPDPAARSIVFALRRKRYRGRDMPADPTTERRQDYIGGVPIEVPLVHPALSYPDQMGVVLDVVRGTDVERELVHANILQLDRAELVLTPAGLQSGSIGPQALDRGQVPARRVVARLAPGDEFELDVWCVPSAIQLERWFDVVEMGALLAVARTCLTDAGGRLSDFGTRTDLQCLTGLEYLMGQTDFAMFRRRLSLWARREPDPQECGLGALNLPTSEVRRELARIVRNQMLKRPIPEIAATRTLRVAHAASKPNFAPRFRRHVLPGTHTSNNLRDTGLEVIRFTFKDDQERANFISENPVEDWHRKGSTITHQNDATDLLLGGYIDADVDSAHSVTIYAELAHPFTHRLDDRRLGRRPEKLGRDLEKVDLDKYDEANPDSKDRTNPSLFGFYVNVKTGKTSFKRQTVILAQFAGLNPSDDVRQRRLGTERINVLRDPLTGKMRVDLKRYVPPDNKARKMLLTIESHGRFSNDFDVAPPDPDRKGATRVSETGNALSDDKLGNASMWVTSSLSTELAAAELKRDADIARQIELWVPATRRPRPINPQSILPAFVWTTEEDLTTRVVQTERRMLARLRFRRPWFSSGEGEKLGIAIWPPNIFAMRRDLGEFDPKVHAFSAAEAAVVQKELSTGGGYITRFGTDPIRKGGVAGEGLFMPIEAFRDAFRKDGNPPRARLIDAIRMPLPKDPETGKFGELHVSLLTYEPLFDPIDEVWYVDVEIAARDAPDGWVRFGIVRYQEHAIDGEQVSEPTPVMVQILPQRRARVWSHERGGTHLVTLTVEGLGSLAAARDDMAIKDEHEHRLMQRPVLRPSLLRRRHGAEGHPDEVDILWAWDEPKADDAPDPFYLEPSRSDAGLLWAHTFELKEAPGSVPNVSYEIIFDEVDLRPAAWPQPGAGLIASGPRFAARIPVPLLRKQ